MKDKLKILLDEVIHDKAISAEQKIEMLKEWQERYKEQTKNLLMDKILAEEYNEILTLLNGAIKELKK